MSRMPSPTDRGIFVWHELNTTDVASAEGFYNKVVGWKTREWDQNPAYKLWVTGREGRGGLWAMVEEPNKAPTPPHWLSYIGTDDVDATVRQTVETGGKVVTPAYDVPKVARMAVLQDPQGAMFAVSAQIERGSGYREPELGEFSWHELTTTNWQTAWEFYSKLFGWQKTNTMDMGPNGIYQMFGIGGNTIGGMFTHAGPMPGGPFWVPYAHIRDAKRAADVIKHQGGNIINGPMEVPGGDWVVIGEDRQGALFAVHSKNTKIHEDPRRSTKTAKGTKTATSTKKGAVKKSKPAKKSRVVKKAGAVKRVKSPKKKAAKKRR
jgi:predicted enzyme related to lactoylglutathione lyase